MMKTKILSTLVLWAGMTLGLSAQKVTVNLQKAKLGQVLSEITSQTGYDFAYSRPTVNPDKIVSIESRDEDIQTTLAKLFKGENLTYEIKDKRIFIKAKGAATESKKPVANKTVKGIVVDEKGEPVIGASVSLKGTDKGTITDFDGNFSLDVPSDGTLNISYLGYQTQQLAANDRNISRITLHEDSKAIDEVVVVGYGVQRKRDVTTSISSVRASDLENMAVSNIEQALIGKMAGVQITLPNGTPGAGANIKVRGVGTVTAGSSPLYVIDGVPLSDDTGNATGITVSPLASLDMNDIESIEVLKDASSAAIYGSRGSNGVVIITTRKGKDGKPKIKYNGYIGVQSVAKKIDILDAYEYSSLVFDGHNASYFDQLRLAKKEHLYNPWATNQERWDNLKSGNINENQGWMLPPEILPYIKGEEGLTNTDWQDEVFRNGFMQKHNLSVSGGNKNIKYLLSGNYQGEEGTVINSDFSKMGFRAKVDLNYNKWKMGGNINLTRNLYNLINSEGRYGDDGVLSLALGAAPIYSVYNNIGEYNYEHNNTSYGQSKLNNPVAVASLIKDKMTALQMLGTAYLEYEFIKNLVFKTQGSWNYNNYVRDYYRPATLPNSTDRTPPSNPTAESRTKNKYTWVWENTLSYSKTINRNSFGGIIGWTAQKYTETGNRITASDLPQNDMMETIPGNATATKYDSFKNEWALLSGLARLQYGYADKYMFSAAVRSDGSSRFGSNNRWGVFPSFSGAWYLSEEKFMKPIDWISNLKIRSSWGVTGNMSIGNYASYGLIRGNNYVFGNQPFIGLEESTAGNPNIGWEKTSQVNLGLELGLFNWLNIELDIYKGITSDMLLEVPVMEVSGFSSVLENIGKVSNKGIELVISTRNVIGNVVWNNSFNYAANRNKVISLGGANEIVTQSNKVIDFMTKVGEPIGNYYTYVVDGVYQNKEEIANDVANGLIVPNAQPGDYRFRKYGKDDVINADDKVITGNYLPKFTYGYSTNVQYKSFDLGVSLQGVYGNEIANINKRYLANMEGNANQLGIARDRWKSESEPGNGSVYKANRAATGMNSAISTWHIEDGSYLRIRDITLGYTFNKRLVSKIGINNLRIYFSTTNPFTFTKYSGYNPEVSSDNSPIMQGVDYGTYPLSKNFIFGLTLDI